MQSLITVCICQKYSELCPDGNTCILMLYGQAYLRNVRAIKFDSQNMHLGVNEE